MGTWRSASEQLVLAYEADVRRLTEWPVGTAPGLTRVFTIDPISIVITHKIVMEQADVSHLDSLPAPRSRLAERRFNILLCGAAAAISATMLTRGARAVEDCMPKYEPLVLLCVTPFPQHPSMVTSGVDNALVILGDPDTTIDAVVWYDIEHPEYLEELRQLEQARSLRKPKASLGNSSERTRDRVPILALRPYATWDHAARDYAAVLAGNLSYHSRVEYLALREMIETGKDDDLNGILQGLS